MRSHVKASSTGSSSGRSTRLTTHAVLLSLAICVLALTMGAALAFAAGPPVISNTAATFVADTKARLEGKVNPNGEGTSYRFEYVTEEDFEDSGYAEATSAPAKGAGIGNGSEAVSVSQLIDGLTLETPYRFRLIATNPSGATFGPSVAFTTGSSYPPPHSFGPCPNEALRAGPTATGPSLDLPDCRAYEQITPVDKNGNTVMGDVDKMQAASDGQAFLYFAEVPIPAGMGRRYIAARDEDGWSSSWFGAGLTSGGFAQDSDWTPDLSSVFGTAEGIGFGREDTADGSVEPIPGGGKYVGASADSSKIFFQSGTELKVWDRDTQTETPVATDAIGGSYDWWNGDLSNGGANRGYYTQDQNVVSTDGAKAYFTTAGEGQLFLREDPAGPSPSTAHVSASKKTNGGGLGGTDPSGPQPAAFMQATPDGDFAFFTSTEELTNDANTGPDAIGRANLDGSSPNHSFIPASAKGIAADATHIYWATPGRDAIGRANLDGTGVNPNFITGADTPQHVAVDGSFVYWTNAGTEFGFEGSIGRANLDGTGVSQAFIATEVGNPSGIAANATHLYWANFAFGSFGTIGRANIDGTNPELFFLFPPNPPSGLALNSTHLFWADPVSNAIGRVKFDGTDFNENFITGASKPQGVAADDTNVYWANSGSAAIGSAKSGATEAEEIDQSLLSSFNPFGIAVNASNVFWSADESAPGKDLYRYDAESGELLDLSPDPSAFNGADVRGVLGASDDGSHVYFVANGDLDGAGDATPGNCSKGSTGDFGSFAGACNLYLWRDDGTPDGDITFVARLDSNPHSGSGRTSDAANWMPGFLSGDGITNSTARVSADGEILLFRSQIEQTAYDNEASSGKCILVDSPSAESPVCPQYYRYSAAEDELACVTCNPTGAAPLATPTLYSLDALGESSPARFLTRNLSADGNRFFFESADKLLAEDVNGDADCLELVLNGNSIVPLPACQDVYMWEAEGTGSCQNATVEGGCLYLLSSGASDAPTFLGDASLSSDDVFIYSYEQLVAQDGDEITDIYDVRVGGGLASQNQPPPVICEGEAGCKPAPNPLPPTESAGSAAFSGPGNLEQRPTKPRPCPKGKRKVRVKGKARCVPKRKGQRRGANKTRRQSR